MLVLFRYFSQIVFDSIRVNRPEIKIFFIGWRIEQNKTVAPALCELLSALPEERSECLEYIGYKVARI